MSIGAPVAALQRAPEGAGPSNFLSRSWPLIFARIFAAGFSLVIPLVLARALSQSEYGTYKQLILVAQTLFYTLQLGMTQSLFFFIPRDIGHQRTYFAQALIFLAAMGAVSATTLLLGSGELAGWLKCPALPRYAPALTVYLVGILCSGVLETSMTARGQTGMSSAFYIGSELVKTAAMTLPILLGEGLTGLVDGLAIFAALRLAATLVMLVRLPGPLLDRKAFRAQLAWALPFGTAILIAVPQQYFHQYAVSARYSSAAFAVYSVGLFNLPLVDLLYTPTSEVLMVAVGELDREGRLRQGAEIFRSAARRLSVAFIPLTVFLLGFAPRFITTLFTARYLASVPIFRIAVLSTLLAIFPLDGVLRARGETWHIFRANVLKACLTVPLTLLGLAYFGLIGSAGACLACEVLGKTYLLSRVPRALGASLRQLIPLSHLVRVAAGAAAALGGGRLAQALVPQAGRPLVALAAAAVGYGAVYVCALPLLGVALPDIAGRLRRAGGKDPLAAAKGT